ncbi:MAG: oligosaccharide flippase family protein, partial [Leptolyngbyaceae cyanobacterium SL_7_1]|nr:oligosaccharide flippase family protein [Leptolyngbyaceae cyanobacterium SL_7_1]
MSIKQKAIKGVAWSAIQNWGSQVGSLLVFFLLARLLTPEAFGLVALANVFLLFMQLLLEQGFSQAIIQREDLEPEHLNTAFWLTLVSGTLLAGIGIFSASWIAELFGQAALTPIIRWVSPLLIIIALARVQQASLERKFNYKAIAARKILATFMGGAVGVLMAFLGFGVWSLVAQQFVFESVGAITLWVCSDWRPGLTVSMRHFR